MDILCSAQTVILIIIGRLVLTPCVSASGENAAYIGDTIPLQGYSYGSPTVYLFLTDPNLPVNGVALNDITALADEGHFNEVTVDGNDHWEYPWGTNAIGGRLDAGTYTGTNSDSFRGSDYAGSHLSPLQRLLSIRYEQQDPPPATLIAGFITILSGNQAFEHIIVNGAKLPSSRGNKGKKPETIGIARSL